MREHETPRGSGGDFDIDPYRNAEGYSYGSRFYNAEDNETFDDPSDRRTQGAEGALTGPYTGRGPKGYRRSDERIYEEVCERLTQHGMIDASEIEVSVNQGVVTLTGTVEERQTMRLVEGVVGSVMGVTDVQNQLGIKHRAKGE
jgi:hypothetical protein